MLCSTGSLLDDDERARTDDLNLGHKTALEVVEFCRFAGLGGPSLSLGHIGQVHDRILDGLIGTNLDKRLIANAATHLDVDQILSIYIAACEGPCIADVSLAIRRAR